MKTSAICLILRNHSLNPLDIHKMECYALFTENPMGKSFPKCHWTLTPLMYYTRAIVPYASLTIRLPFIGPNWNFYCDNDYEMRGVIKLDSPQENLKENLKGLPITYYQHIAIDNEIAQNRVHTMFSKSWDGWIPNSGAFPFGWLSIKNFKMSIDDF